jgi:transcription elongation factor Elf1
MEAILKTELSFGQRLYYLSKKNKTIYAPCPTCNNERKVTLMLGKEEFTIDCPKCTGKYTKGDIKNYLHIDQYSLDFCVIKSFVYNEDKRWSLVISRHFGEMIDMQTLAKHDYVDEEEQFYTDESEAKAEMTKLNKIEQQKQKDFLSQFSKP